MKPPPPQPHAFRPGSAQAASSVQPQQGAPARVVQVVAAPLSANLALRRLYDEALAAYPSGPRGFAEAAYGPFGHVRNGGGEIFTSPMARALHRIENIARTVISLATPQEAEHASCLLRSGNLLAATRYLLDTVHRRLVHTRALLGRYLSPVNEQAYTSPALGPTAEDGVDKRVRAARPDTPTLTVSLPNSVVPSNEFCRQLGAMMRRDGLGDLHGGSPIEIEPPRLGRASGPRCWYLDVRPTAPGRLTHTNKSSPQFKTLRLLPRTLFHAVAGLPGDPPMFSSLKLRLLPGVPEVPGYYPLEVVGR